MFLCVRVCVCVCKKAYVLTASLVCVWKIACVFTLASLVCVCVEMFKVCQIVVLIALVAAKSKTTHTDKEVTTPTPYSSAASIMPMDGNIARKEMDAIAVLMNVESVNTKINVDAELKLKLYGLYTQAIKGDAPKNSAAPFWDFEKTLKLSAWKEMKGKLPMQCVEEYRQIAKSVYPNM